MTFRVGQKVVCVDDATDPGCDWEGEEAPIAGQVYTVARFFYDEDADGIVYLVEIARGAEAREEHGPDIGYAARRFRPITDIKFAHEILARVSRKGKVSA